MNKERLQTLKDQAWATCQEPEDYMDKFAELIVRENVDLLRKEWYALNNQEALENETPRALGIRLGKKTELITMIHKIKEHFGVEE